MEATVTSTRRSSRAPGATGEGVARSVRRLCVVAIVAGVILVAAGAYTGYVEGVRADETHTAGSLMPAEVVAVVVGPVLTVMGSMLLYRLRRPRR